MSLSLITRWILQIILILTTVVSATPTLLQRTPTSGPSFNPTPQDLIQERYTPVISSRGCQSNADCLRRGLPLLKPQRRQTSSSGTSFVAHSGRIRVADTTGSDLGYLSSALNSFGEYFSFTADPATAVQISFPAALTQETTQIPITVSAQSTYPFFGGVVGFSSTSNNLGSGSDNYVYIAQIASKTPLGSPAIAGANTFTAATSISKDVETSIWTYKPSTNAITAIWMNDNGLGVQATIVDVGGQAIALTGDKTSFDATFGTSTALVFFFESD